MLVVALQTVSHSGSRKHSPLSLLSDRSRLHFLALEGGSWAESSSWWWSW